jgi:hypothetical protein
MGYHDRLRPGSRVMVQGEPSGLTLRSHYGYIVSPDHLWDDFYIVRLDQPAVYYNLDGSIDEWVEIREAVDNLTLVSS